MIFSFKVFFDIFSNIFKIYFDMFKFDIFKFDMFKISFGMIFPAILLMVGCKRSTVKKTPQTVRESILHEYSSDQSVLMPYTTSGIKIETLTLYNSDLHQEDRKNIKTLALNRSMIESIAEMKFNKDGIPEGDYFYKFHSNDVVAETHFLEDDFTNSEIQTYLKPMLVIFYEKSKFKSDDPLFQIALNWEAVRGQQQERYVTVLPFDSSSSYYMHKYSTHPEVYQSIPIGPNVRQTIPGLQFKIVPKAYRDRVEERTVSILALTHDVESELLSIKYRYMDGDELRESVDIPIDSTSIDNEIYNLIKFATIASNELLPTSWSSGEIRAGYKDKTIGGVDRRVKIRLLGDITEICFTLEDRAYVRVIGEHLYEDSEPCTYYSFEISTTEGNYINVSNTLLNLDITTSVNNSIKDLIFRVKVRRNS